MARRERENDDRSADGGTRSASLRAVMATFPTGVTVVATRDPQGAPVGLTVNSFTSVSLEPPLVLVCIAHAAGSHDGLIASDGFVVSVLSGTQDDIALRFARQPSDGRFDEVGWWPAPSGNPVLEGATAWLDCSIEELMEAGDHTIILARALACGSSETPALLFHRGTLSPVQTSGGRG